jgi:hypothetical protein
VFADLGRDYLTQRNQISERALGEAQRARADVEQNRAEFRYLPRTFRCRNPGSMKKI